MSSSSSQEMTSAKVAVTIRTAAPTGSGHSSATPRKKAISDIRWRTSDSRVIQRWDARPRSWAAPYITDNADVPTVPLF